MGNQLNIEDLSKRAEQGDAVAIRELADCYYDGEGVEKITRKHSNFTCCPTKTMPRS